MDSSFIAEYKVVFDTVRFTHLNIISPTLSNGMLVKIIQLLPNLDSLKISSLQLDSIAMSLCTVINNKITKVCHVNTTDTEQISFLLYLCICVQHFQIHVSTTIDLNVLLRLILTKTKAFVPRLRSLCLWIPIASDDTIRQLQDLIESERLLSNYLIKRSGDSINLKWD